MIPDTRVGFGRYPVHYRQLTHPSVLCVLCGVVGRYPLPRWGLGDTQYRLLGDTQYLSVFVAVAEMALFSLLMIWAIPNTLCVLLSMKLLGSGKAHCATGLCFRSIAK